MATAIRRYRDIDMCSGNVKDQFSVGFHGCTFSGKLEYEGKRYCAKHYPPNVEARHKKSMEAYLNSQSHRPYKRIAELTDVAKRMLSALMEANLHVRDAEQGGRYDKLIAEASRIIGE